MDQSEIKEINRLRSVLGLPLIKILKKMCLNCGIKFESEGNHNRMCEVCRKKEDNKYE